MRLVALLWYGVLFLSLVGIGTALYIMAEPGVRRILEAVQ